MKKVKHEKKKSVPNLFSIKFIQNRKMLFQRMLFYLKKKKLLGKIWCESPFTNKRNKRENQTDDDGQIQRIYFSIISFNRKDESHQS